MYIHISYLEPDRQTGIGPAGCRLDPVVLFKPAGFQRFFNQFWDVKKERFCPFLSIFMALTTDRYASESLQLAKL